MDFSDPFYYIYTNEKRLLNNGYSKEYILFLKNDHKKRNLGIGIGIPVLLLTAFSIYWILFGFPDTFNHLIFIFLILCLLILPFPIMDIRESKKAYKKLALDTNSEIIIDIKFRVLHKFFNPAFEVFFLIIFTIYFIVSSHTIPAFFLIHILLPWLVYLGARNSKYQTKPLIKDGYTLIFSVITFNFLLVLYYLFRYGIQCVECTGSQYKIGSIIVFLFLFLKIVYSTYNFIITRKFYARDISK
jgi:hypothetical protein